MVPFPVRVTDPGGVDSDPEPSFTKSRSGRVENNIFGSELESGLS